MSESASSVQLQEQKEGDHPVVITLCGWMLKGSDIKTGKDGRENEIESAVIHASFSGVRAFTVNELNTKVGLQRRSCGEEEHSNTNNCKAFSDLFFFFFLLF